MNRKKRLEKGINSIEEQIKIHQNKKEIARTEGKLELEDYYKVELSKLEAEKKKKQELLDKS